ncbi:hypothetical protein LINPERPRIM_LOCUS39854 [Linum perenne]
MSSTMADLLSLSRGPSQIVKCFKGYVINGHRYHIKDPNKQLKTQNYGVVVLGDDGTDVDAIDYYGSLREVIELDFLGGRTLTLFLCDWCDVHDKRKGINIDAYGFISINPKRSLKTNEPFVLASQVSPVFFVEDHAKKNWHLVVKVQQRGVY